MKRTAALAAVPAAVMFVLALVGFGAALEGYSQARHPPALLGARAMAHATAFNWAGFVIPGLLAAVAAIALRERLPAAAGGPARIGAWLLLLSALAFAAQGLAPLNLQDLDGRDSQWHATAWTLWWIAAAAGALSVGAGLLRQPGSRGFALAALLASGLVAALSVLPPALWSAGVGQRVAIGAWLGLLMLAGRQHRPSMRHSPAASEVHPGSKQLAPGWRKRRRYLDAIRGRKTEYAITRSAASSPKSSSPART